MATPESRSGLERIFNLNPATIVPASVTNEYILFKSDRDYGFREIGITALQTVTSGAPATNNIRAEFWNLTDTTILAKATITGASSGTLLERASFVSIATKAQFIGPGASASVNKVFGIKFVGANTLNRGIIRPSVHVVADVIN